MSNELTVQKTQLLVPSTMKEALDMASMMQGSALVPEKIRNNPAEIFMTIQLGLSVGLNPIQSLQNIAVINNKPTLWGDAMAAVCKAHPKWDGMLETFDEETMTATCEVRRKGDSNSVWTFSREDAKSAGLWNRKGPWTQYTKRMLQMRARGFALRDAFPDALQGIISREEAEDYQSQEPRDITPKSSGGVFPFTEAINTICVCQTLEELQDYFISIWKDLSAYRNTDGFNNVMAAKDKKKEELSANHPPVIPQPEVEEATIVEDSPELKDCIKSLKKAKKQGFLEDCWEENHLRWEDMLGPSEYPKLENEFQVLKTPQTGE